MTGLRLNQIVNANNNGIMQDYYELTWDIDSNEHILSIHGIEPSQKMITANNVSGLSYARYALDRNMYVADLSDADNNVLAFRVDNGVIIIVEENVANPDTTTIDYVKERHGARDIYSINDYDRNEFGCINFDIPTNVVTAGITDFLVCYKITAKKIVCQRLKFYAPNVANFPSYIYNRIGFKLYYNPIDNIHEAYPADIQGLWLLTMPSGWNIPTDLKSRYNPSVVSNSGSGASMFVQRMI